MSEWGRQNLFLSPIHSIRVLIIQLGRLFPTALSLKCHQLDPLVKEHRLFFQMAPVMLPAQIPS